MSEEEVPAMPEVLSVSRAKQNLPEIIREASNRLKVYRVGNLRQRSPKTSLIIGEETIRALVKDVRCNAEWEEDTEQGLWTVYVSQLDVFGQGRNKDEAVEDLLASVTEYVTLYMEDIPFYFKVGRDGHLPFILALSLHADDPHAQRAILGV